MAPYNTTLDLYVGGTSTGPATFSVAANTGNIDTSGTITAATSGTINGININSGALSGISTLNATSTITFSGLGTGTDDTVVIANGSGQLTTDEIDSRVWGTTLTDATGTPTVGQAAYWSDANTLAAENYLSTSRGGTGLNASSASNGMLLIGNGSGLQLGYITGGTGIALASSSGNITVSHTDASSVADSTNTGSTVIQSLGFDDLGHVDSLGTVDVATALSSTFDNYQYWNISDGATNENITTTASVVFDETDNTGVDVAYNATNNTISIAGVDATTTTKGVASFSGTDFSVTTGAVSINLLKDLVAGNGLTGGADNVLVGSDSDVTLTVNPDNTGGVAGGLVVGANGISLNRSCSPNQILKWSASTGWTCSEDTSGGVANYWQLDAGTGKALSPYNSTLDVLIGATSTASSAFAFSGISGTTPKMLFNNDIQLYRSAAGTLDTTASTINLGGGSNATIATTSNGNLTLAPNGSGVLKLDPTGAGSIAIGSGDVTSATIDAVAVSFDATTTSNLTVNGSAQSLTLQAMGGGVQKVNLSSAGTGTDAVNIDATAGGIDLLAAGVFSIDSSNGNSNVTATSGDLTLSTLTTGNIIISAAQALDIDAAGMVTLNNSGVGNDITVTSVDDITLAPADVNSLYFTNFNNCTYLTTGASGQVGCSTTTLPTASDILWKASSDGKAIIEKNTTMDLLVGGIATSSSTFAVNALTGVITAGTNNNLTFIPSGTGDLVLTADNDTNMQINSTVNSDVSINPVSVTLTDNANGNTGTIYAVDVTNNDNTTNTGVPDALVRINNANAAETVPDGLRIEQTGAGTMSSAIDILKTAGTITTGITIGNSATTTGISLGTGLTTGISVGSGGIGVTAGGVTITAGALAVNSDSITSDGVLTIEGTDAVVLGTGTNGFRVDETWSDSTSGFTGTAQPPVKVTLVPEFSGATLTGDGSNNIGAMTSDFCSGSSRRNLNTSVCTVSTEEHNYYSWTSLATNDYDIWLRWKVPSDFSTLASSNPIVFYGWRTSSSDGVTLTIYNPDGSVCGTATSISGTVATWNSTNYANSGCIPTADNFLLLRTTLSVGVNNEFTRVGEIEINYKAKF